MHSVKNSPDSSKIRLKSKTVKWCSTCTFSWKLEIRSLSQGSDQCILTYLSPPGICCEFSFCSVKSLSLLFHSIPTRTKEPSSFLTQHMKSMIVLMNSFLGNRLFFLQSPNSKIQWILHMVLFMSLSSNKLLIQTPSNRWISF